MNKLAFVTLVLLAPSTWAFAPSLLRTAPAASLSIVEYGRPTLCLSPLTRRGEANRHTTSLLMQQSDNLAVPAVTLLRVVAGVLYVSSSFYPCLWLSPVPRTIAQKKRVT